MTTRQRASIYTWLNQGEIPARGSGPLNGLTLVVKDLFDIRGIPTGAGNPEWLHTHPVPGETAEAVTRLLEAGARLRGKTLTDELAFSLNGINRHYGTPPNPRAPDRIPGGSSSGSAAAVALGEADIGLGTDTGGSVRVPAAYCGLYGLRTSHGVVSRHGLVPLAPGFDTVGWLTAHPYIMDRVNSVLLPGDGEGEFPELVVIRPVIAGTELWQEHHRQWLEKVRPRFARVTTLPIPDPWWRRAGHCFRVLQGRQIWATHGDWIESAGPSFADDIRERVRMCAALTEEDERAARAEAEELVRDIETDWLPQESIAVALPTTPGPAPLLDADAGWLKRYRQQLLGLTAPAGLGGLPQLHVPFDVTPPQGVSLLGRAGTDRALTRLAMRLMDAES